MCLLRGVAAFLLVQTLTQLSSACALAVGAAAACLPHLVSSTFIAGSPRR